MCGLRRSELLVQTPQNLKDQNHTSHVKNPALNVAKDATFRTGHPQGFIGLGWRLVLRPAFRRLLRALRLG